MPVEPAGSRTSAGREGEFTDVRQGRTVLQKSQQTLHRIDDFASDSGNRQNRD
jgi:hypothetical protein